MSKVGAGPRIYDTLQYQHAREFHYSGREAFEVTASPTLVTTTGPSAHAEPQMAPRIEQGARSSRAP